MNPLRRSILITGLLAPLAALAKKPTQKPATAKPAKPTSPAAKPADVSGPCVPNLDALVVGSDESPFFEHYHQIVIPVSALVTPPADGLRVVTTAIDLQSYDAQALEKLVNTTSLKREQLLEHAHEFTITAEQLSRIARGDKGVEIRVISEAGNYVHNFKVTAFESALVKVRRGVPS